MSEAQGDNDDNDSILPRRYTIICSITNRVVSQPSDGRTPWQNAMKPEAFISKSMVFWGTVITLRVAE